MNKRPHILIGKSRIMTYGAANYDFTHKLLTFTDSKANADQQNAIRDLVQFLRRLEVTDFDDASFRWTKRRPGPTK